MLELTKENVEDFIRELTPLQASTLANIISECKVRFIIESIRDTFGIEIKCTPETEEETDA